MEALKKLNGWVYQAERFIVVVSLLVMSVVVFLTVLQRSYTDEDSALFGKIATAFFGAERDDATWERWQSIGDWIVPIVLAGIVYAAFRTASRRPLWNRGDESGKSKAELHGEPLPHLKCAIYTVLTVAGGYLGLVLLYGTGRVPQHECIEAGHYTFDCGRFPKGMPWAAPFSLILTLWVGFLGASMATRDNLHLKVESVQRGLPEKMRRVTGLLSGVLTAVFCLVLAYLGWRYVLARHEQWVRSDGLGGLHDNLPIPYFVSFTIVPIAWVLMSLRFIGTGVLAFRGELDETPVELRDLPKNDDGAGAEPEAEAPQDHPAAEADAEAESGAEAQTEAEPERAAKEQQDEPAAADSASASAPVRLTLDENDDEDEEGGR